MRLPRTVRERLAAMCGEDGIALMLALFMIVIVGTLTVAIGAVVVGQVRPSQSERKLTRTVSASEAGFDAALSRIRAATKVVATARGSVTRGDITRLPCGPITGQVSNNTGGLTYSVDIAYYSRKPLTPANALACSAAGTAVVPAFATLTSKGAGADVPGLSAGAADRTLRTIYDFKTTNANVPGGLIHLYDQDTPLCLQVKAKGNPVLKNDKLALATCDGTNPGQIWSYTTDLLLQIVGTNLCLEAASVAGTPITLQPCAPTRPEQKWSFNDIGRFEGDTGGNTNGFCFTAKDDPAVDGSQMLIQKECGGAYDHIHTLSPEAKVGAGAAGESIGNLVNYKFFGRCLDITNQNVDVAWLIGYPCKQRPDPRYLTWNQVFTFDAATKQYRTAAPGGASCLQAGDNTTPPGSMTRVLTKPCNVGETYQRWTPTKATGSYASSYNIKSDNGLCLTLGDGPGVGEANAYLNQWGMIILQTCNGSLEQKWNAPPDTINAKLSNTREGTGG